MRQRCPTGIPGLVLAPFIAAALLLAGCGSGSNVNDGAALLASRFEQHSPQSLLDVITIEINTAEAITLCMKEQGFDYVGYPYSREQELLPELVEASRDPAVFARTRGYGITRPEMMGPDPLEVMTPIDPDYETALYGRPVSEMAQNDLPPEGCWGTSSRPMIAATVAFGEGRQELNALVDADSDVEASRQAWARCMASQGYSYYSPAEATQDFSDANGDLFFASGPGDPVTEEEADELLQLEIATAVTDQLECGGVEHRTLRLEIAADIGLSTDAQSALQVLAAGSGAEE